MLEFPSITPYSPPGGATAHSPFLSTANLKSKFNSFRLARLIPSNEKSSALCVVSVLAIKGSNVLAVVNDVSFLSSKKPLINSWFISMFKREFKVSLSGVLRYCKVIGMPFSRQVNKSGAKRTFSFIGPLLRPSACN